MRFFLALSLLFCVLASWSQTESETLRICDSLRQERAKCKTRDTQYIKLLIRLSETLYVIAPDSIIPLSRLTLRVTQEQIDRGPHGERERYLLRNQLANAQLNLAYGLMQKGQFDEALPLFNSCIKVFEEQDDGSGKSSAYMNMALTFHNMGKVNMALTYYYKALQVSRYTNDQEGMAYCYHNLGAMYSAMGETQKAIDAIHQSLAVNQRREDLRGLAHDHEYLGLIYLNKGRVAEALAHFQKGIQYHKKTGDRYGLCQSIYNISSVYRDQGEVGKALENFRECELLCLETGNNIILGTTYGSIGLIFESGDHLDSALHYFKKELKAQQRSNYISGLSLAYHHLGGVYEDLKQYELAESNYMEALKIRKQTGEKKDECYSYEALGNLMLNTGKLAEAMNYAGKAYSLAVDLGYPKNLRNTSRLLYFIHLEKGNKKEAYKYFDIYYTMHDSIHNESTRKASIKAHLKLDFDKKAVADSVEREKSRTIKNAELARQKALLRSRKNQQYALSGGLVLVMFFSIFIYRRFRIISSQKNIIEKQKVEVEKQKLLVEEKQKEILDSIYYAKRIQLALIPSENILRKLMERAKLKR